METREIRLGPGGQLAWQWQGLVAEPEPEFGGELEGGEVVTLRQLGVRLAVVEAGPGQVVLRVETPAEIRLTAAGTPETADCEGRGRPAYPFGESP